MSLNTCTAAYDNLCEDEFADSKEEAFIEPQLVMIKGQSHNESSRGEAKACLSSAFSVTGSISVSF